MTVGSADEVVKRIEAAFWRRYNASPELRAKLAGKDRVLQLDLTDGPGTVFTIQDGKLASVAPGRHPKPDVVITVATGDLLRVFNGELKALEAYLTRRIRVKASFGDVLFAKSLLGW